MRIPTFLATASALALVSGNAIAQCSNYSLLNPGSLISAADEQIYNVALPFPFLFYGVAHNSITISSNGWIKFGEATATSAQYNDNEASLLSGDPRVAVLWDDLNAATSGGGIYYSADATQASVTWQNVGRYNAPAVLSNHELILLPTGEMYFVYDASGTFNTNASSCSVGIGPGQNLLAAGTHLVDWSAAVPGPMAVVDSCGYEQFAPGTFDLVGKTLHFVPTGATSYDVSEVPTLGACVQLPTYPGLADGPTVTGPGCPAPVPNSSLYEIFDNDGGGSPQDHANTSILFSRSGESYFTLPGSGFDTSYASVTPTIFGDEEIISFPVGPMGTFPFGELAVTDIRVSSNGFIALDTSITSPDWSSTTAEFHSQGPRIAFCWHDLDPATGGTIYFDNSNPAYWLLTFDAVKEYGYLNYTTVQVKGYSTGDIEINTGAVACTTGNPIVGISRGFANDPGTSDLISAGVVNFIGPVDIVGTNSMTHQSTQFAIGKTWVMSASYANSVIGFFIVGLNNPGLPLDAIGAPGCVLSATLDFTYAQPFVGTGISQTVGPIPYNPSYSGQVFFSQAAAFSSDNALGLVASNGLSHVLGL